MSGDSLAPNVLRRHAHQRSVNVTSLACESVNMTSRVYKHRKFHSKHEMNAPCKKKSFVLKERQMQCFAAVQASEGPADTVPHKDVSQAGRRQEQGSGTQDPNHSGVRKGLEQKKNKKKTLGRGWAGNKGELQTFVSQVRVAAAARQCIGSTPSGSRGERGFPRPRLRGRHGCESYGRELHREVKT